MSHVYRAYYAIRGLSTRAGFPTNAIYGFTTMLRKLIVEENPAFLGVAIDLAGPTIRHQQYEDYKATRRPMPDDLAPQIPFVIRVCETLSVPVLSYPRYEADDVIGTITRKATAEGLQVVIITIDKDMLQLVNERVNVLDTRTMTRFDPDKVREKWGVAPEKVIDVLSLVGDSSDNIPGAPGIGEKGAKKLIQEYGNLEGLLTHRDQVGRKTYRESLQQNEDLIRQSRELLRIHDDLPLELNLPELQLSEPDYEAARELFTELEFTSLVEEFTPTSPVSVDHGEIETLDQLSSLISRVSDKTVSMCLSAPDGNGLALALSEETGKALYIGPQLVSRQPAAVEELLAGPGRWVIHDLKSLLGSAHRQGWHLDGDHLDTMLMAYLLTPNHNDFSLERVTLDYLHFSLSKAGEGGQLFEPQDVQALCERADATLRLSQPLLAKLEENELLDLLAGIEIPLVEVLVGMEEAGVKVDTDLLAEMSSEVQEDVQKLTDRIYQLAGQEFNINSPKQLASVLFEELALPSPKKTRKAGHFATGVEVLQELSEHHEIARLILEYRELTKLKNTYLDALPKLVRPGTGRIHTSFNQMVAATGRLSSSNPNLQNIPIKSELGRKIRRAFVAGPECQLLAADYSQIELRVMAHLSEDPVLTQAFQQGEDIHERTAREVFGMNAVMEPRRFRRLAKVINFGVMYGLSAFGLAQNLKIERKEAQQFIDSYFQKYAGVKTWIDRTLEEAYDRGYVTTLFGRIRQIPELRSKNWSRRSFGERTAINAPIQGTAADLIKKAMVSIHQKMKQRPMRSRLILQVHDELVFEVESSEMEEMKLLVRQEMEGVVQLKVPLRVDVAVGPSWYEAK